MAKARQIAGETMLADPQEWFAEMLRIRFGEVVSYREAALDIDRIDGIHDIRVAIRRLRSMIRDFDEISEMSLKPVTKDLKRLADALGRVRDTDVAIEALEQLAEKARNDRVREGIAVMISRLRMRRINAMGKLRKDLSPEAIAEMEKRFEKGLTSSLNQRNLFATTDLKDAICEIIGNRVDDFRNLADALYQPFEFRDLHRLRIAGKHLRYAVELFAVRSEEDGTDFGKDIADMQTDLGNVHDCDAWIAQLEQGLIAKKRGSLKGPERDAAIWLLSQFVRFRFRAYRSALALWVQWQESGLLDRLKEWKPATGTA